MHHVAILDKKRKLLDKIYSGIKKIESRWYQTRRTPWKNISKGDTVFFKDAGELITLKADVSDVLFFDELNKEKVLDIFKKYGTDLGFVDKTYSSYYDKKKYCILVFLSNVEKITPFDIDKTGFGNACAWMTLDDISKIRI